MKRLMQGAKVIGDYPDDWVPPAGSDLSLGLADGTMGYVATPEEDPAVVADRARVAAIEANIAGFSFGGKTLAQLKAMDNAAFDDWWGTNVTNLAQANAVLKLLSRAALRRIL